MRDPPTRGPGGKGGRPASRGPGAPIRRGGEGPGLLRKLVRSLVSGGLYTVAASFVMGVAREVTRQLPMPPLFLTSLAGLLVLGLVLTLVLAWRYESVGQDVDAPPR